MYTESQSVAKQRFWRRFKAQNSGTDATALNNVQISRLAGDANIINYLSDPVFYDWFMNEKTEDDLIKSSSEVAIKFLRDMVIGVQEVPANARVAAAKILLDMDGRGAKSQKEVVYRDETIARMDKAELESFIKSQSDRLN